MTGLCSSHSLNLSYFFSITLTIITYLFLKFFIIMPIFWYQSINRSMNVNNPSAPSDDRNSGIRSFKQMDRKSNAKSVKINEKMQITNHINSKKICFNILRNEQCRLPCLRRLFVNFSMYDYKLYWDHRPESD